MSLMIVPEFILQTTLKGLITKLQLDYAANSADTTKSLLYKMTLGVGFERYQFFQQAAKVFCGPVDDSRKLEVDLMFNMKRNGPPTIHITLPAENSATNGNGFGTDEGFLDPTDIIDPDYNNDTGGSETPIFTRRFRAAYNVVVTSDNSNEVILVYHITRALLIAAIPHLSLSGLENISFGGNDVRPYTPELANQLYMRAIIVNMEYDTSVPKLDQEFLPAGIIVDGIPESTESEP